MKILADPRIISALIAGLVSFFVAWRTTRGDRKAREAERAEKLLLEVYNPIETAFLNNKSLYSYVFQNKGTLEKTRRKFSNKIRPLIDEALSQHYPPSGIHMDFSTPHERQEEEKAAKETDAKLKDIESRLRPLLAAEINRLQKLVDKG